MRRPALAPLAAATLLALAACTPEPPPTPPTVPNPTIIQPTRGIHLRAAFDDDPTAYVGRFVPDTLAKEQVDETTAAQTRCSEHFVTKVVNSNQEIDEVAYTSTKVAGGIGIKPFASASGSMERGAMVRIKYTLSKRMQVTIKDPAALQRCCAASPDQCGEHVIGEFLMGSGEVFQMAGTQRELEATTAAKQVTGEVTYKDGMGWKKVNAFKDMYFAFLTTDSGVRKAPVDDACGWCDNIPPSPDGQHFCGMSPPAPSEQMARDLAMQNARLQVVKFVGESLSSQSTSEASLVKGYLEDKQVTTAAASGIASQVKDVKWCKAATTNTPEGVKYTGKVLAFLANADKTKATQSLLDSMLAAEGKDEKAEDPKGKDPGKGKAPKAAKPKARVQALEKLKEKIK